MYFSPAQFVFPPSPVSLHAALMQVVLMQQIKNDRPAPKGERSLN